MYIAHISRHIKNMFNDNSGICLSFALEYIQKMWPTKNPQKAHHVIASSVENDTRTALDMINILPSHFGISFIIF